MLHVFGLTETIPTRNELAEEAFERYVTTQPVSPIRSRESQEVFNSYLLNPTARQLIEEGKFAELRASDAGLYRAISSLAPAERGALIEYIRAEVPLSEFVKAPRMKSVDSESFKRHY